MASNTAACWKTSGFKITQGNMEDTASGTESVQTWKINLQVNEKCFVHVN
jgi:hypothetical protein